VVGEEEVVVREEEVEEEVVEEEEVEEEEEVVVVAVVVRNATKPAPGAALKSFLPSHRPPVGQGVQGK
jgi:hypothetical protein